MNICFETFGCRLNRAEALDMEAHARALGHRIVDEHGKADLIVVRGCSVTSRAQHDCEKTISHLKHRYPNTRLVVLGCLPGAQRSFVLPDRSGRTFEAPPVSTRTARAYLKVQDGCTCRCTFCIVPRFRGASVSQPFDALLDKARRFIDAGYREIVLTGCNLALYADAGKRLPELVDALAGLDASCRLRLGSVEPGACADALLDAMAAHGNVCRFLHLPVQSGSNRILGLMNRPYAIADVEALVTKARRLMPKIALGCDLMTGFPGESEGDFLMTRDVLSRHSFALAHLFPYSERPGTAAAKLPGIVPQHVRSERARLLERIARASRSRYAKQFVGETVDVVVESHGTQAKGWTGEYLWFEGPVRVARGATVPRKHTARWVVRSVDGDVLHGVLAADGGRDD